MSALPRRGSVTNPVSRTDRVLASGSTPTLVLLTVIALGALGVMAALDIRPG
jgi:ABC-type protease/lipase transport system fused ATPase/permease subunit